MRPKTATLLKTLDLGTYLVYVNRHGHASAVGITSGSMSTFRREIYGRCADDLRRPSYSMTEEGSYIVRVGGSSHVEDVIATTPEELRTFLLDVLGA